nr:hypothetical protein [Bifidobacterium stellenboschense]
MPIHNPIESTEKLVPGEYPLADGDLTINEGKDAIELDVVNNHRPTHPDRSPLPLLRSQQILKYQ